MSIKNAQLTSTTTTTFETIATDELAGVNGGADFWSDLGDAAAGAVRIVRSPFVAVGRGVAGTVGALNQGHSLGDSLSNGLVRAAGTMNAPDLSKIPANPAPVRPAMPMRKN